MTGKEIFDKYVGIKDPSTEERDYINTLRTAFMIDRSKLFRMLEDADKEGKQIGLSYPVPIGDGPSEPDEIILI